MKIEETLGGQAYLLEKKWEAVKQEIADAMHITVPDLMHIVNTVSTMINSRRRNKVIFVEGNIGAGKSTFLAIMKTLLGEVAEIVPEPVPAKYLDFLCNDPMKWAFPFQLIMATLREEAQNTALKAEEQGKLVFLERSLHADSIFANIAIKDEVEKQWYRNFRDNVLGDIIQTPDLIIYLDSSVDGCMQRIEKRASEDEDRKGELKYDIKYIEELCLGHDEFIYDEAIMIAPVLVIDVDNVDFRKKLVGMAITRKIADILASKEEMTLVEFRQEDVVDFASNMIEDAQAIEEALEAEKELIEALNDMATENLRQKMGLKKPGNDGAKQPGKWPTVKELGIRLDKPFGTCKGRCITSAPAEMRNLSEVLADLKNFNPFSLI